MITRMPPRTIDVWEQQRKVAVTPKLDELLEFLSGRARGRLHHDGVHEESHGGERYTHKKFDNEKPYASHESQNSEALGELSVQPQMVVQTETIRDPRQMIMARNQQ